MQTRPTSPPPSNWRLWGPNPARCVPYSLFCGHCLPSWIPLSWSFHLYRLTTAHVLAPSSLRPRFCWTIPPFVLLTALSPPSPLPHEKGPLLFHRRLHRIDRRRCPSWLHLHHQQFRLYHVVRRRRFDHLHGHDQLAPRQAPRTSPYHFHHPRPRGPHQIRPQGSAHQNGIPPGG